METDFLSLFSDTATLQSRSWSHNRDWTLKAHTHWADFPSADSDSSAFRILNMFDMDSRGTIVKWVVESADSGIELADSNADSASNPLRFGQWVRALRLIETLDYPVLTLDTWDWG